MRDCTQRHSPAPLDARTPRAPLETHGPPHTALQDLADVATPYSASLRAGYTPAVAPIARGELRLLGEVGDHDGGGRNGGVAGCSSVVRRREGSAERHARYERGRCADCAWRSR